MKVNNGAGAVTNELLQAMGGSKFIGKNAATTRELRRARERQAKRERIRDLKQQNGRGI
jgi:hypothetical protein|tara:strand:+ start:302 stop:478 length:177 start_codon:yes stop_codon:yes gene_type:complete